MCIRDRPGPSEDAATVLTLYDYVTAGALLGKLGDPPKKGIYIVSTMVPLSTVNTIRGEYLFQDLTRIPPNVVDAWVSQFMIQATQQDYWRPDSMDRFALELRTRIAQAAEITPSLR